MAAVGKQVKQLMEKTGNFFKIYKQHGGVIGNFLQIYRTDELKLGNEVGQDKYGNKYYENNMYFYGRNRWVQYSPGVNMDYDGSQIPAEWHRWMHYITDKPPTEAPPVDRKWIIDHTENLSASDKAYVPFSTTKPKIESWVPPQVAKK
ncbi:unnamed protein product [Owenia fusiformis]|uniref:NADH dehydrogenase [ubiquinone] 1 alpha subcomplex subunit 12 n=1 Tax=Owenia fusiformis TaxID=6347 RepID=A0A8J1XF77_OWEFU|nr:unnamed protein product [Owenia fusiformis]